MSSGRLHDAEELLVQFGEMSRHIAAPPSLNAGVVQRALFSRKRNSRKRRAMIILAIAVIGTAMTVMAAARFYSRGFEKQMALTEGEKGKAEGGGIIHFPSAESTSDNAAGPCITFAQDSGITVSVQQTAADAFSAWISFRVEGYDAGSSTPWFMKTDLTIDGMPADAAKVSYGWRFYDENFYEAYFLDESGNVINRSKLEDGSYELLMHLTWDEEKGVLPGRLIEVAFSDIATMENGIKEPKAVVNGKWSLRWKLEGVSETTRKECCFAIGDTGATVKAIEIAPMSVKLKIERPYEENTGGWTDSVGPLTNVLPPPAFAGVRMKDGQIRTVAEDYIVETQCARFEERVDTDTAVFTETVYFTRIIDMDNVTAFLFENPAYQVQKAEILIPVTFGTE